MLSSSTFKCGGRWWRRRRWNRENLLRRWWRWWSEKEVVEEMAEMVKMEKIVEMVEMEEEEVMAVCRNVICGWAALPHPMVL